MNLLELLYGYLVENGFDPAVGTSGKFMMIEVGHNESYVGVFGNTRIVIYSTKLGEWHSINFMEPGSFDNLLGICRD